MQAARIHKAIERWGTAYLHAAQPRAAARLAQSPRLFLLPTRLVQCFANVTQSDIADNPHVVRRLRQKLGDDADQPRYIQTEWGVGYRCVPPG